jgi:hypothetical protein
MTGFRNPRNRRNQLTGTVGGNRPGTDSIPVTKDQEATDSPVPEPIWYRFPASRLPVFPPNGGTPGPRPYPGCRKTSPTWRSPTWTSSMAPDRRPNCNQARG